MEYFNFKVYVLGKDQRVSSPFKETNKVRCKKFHNCVMSVTIREIGY